MKLRLLKLMVQPVYVLDDGETLEERPGEAFTLTSADIPVFPFEWAERFAALQARVAAEGSPDQEGAAEGGDDQT